MHINEAEQIIKLVKVAQKLGREAGEWRLVILWYGTWT